MVTAVDLPWVAVGKVVATLSLLIAVGVLAAPPSGAQVAGQLCGGEPVTILGTASDDFIEGTEGPDVILALQGNDTIFGFGGDDIICAGQGDDFVVGGQGFDILFGAQGADYMISGDSSFSREDSRGARMFGGAGNDILQGSTRWDRIQGGAGDDWINGYEGRDWIRGGADSDYVDGGGGIDDLHGGNGTDWLFLSEGDSVRGGAGRDRCNTASGEPAAVRSCESLSDDAVQSRGSRSNPFPLGIVLAWEDQTGGDWGTKIGAPIVTSVADNAEGFSQCVYLPVTVITLTASADKPITDGFTIEAPQPVMANGAVLTPTNFNSACDLTQIRWPFETRGVERSTITYDLVFALRPGESIEAYLHGNNWLATS